MSSDLKAQAVNDKVLLEMVKNALPDSTEWYRLGITVRNHAEGLEIDDIQLYGIDYAAGHEERLKREP